MCNQLLNLFRANARKGSVKAEGNTIWLYDFIVSSEDDASWMGGVSAEGFNKLLATMTGPVTVRLNSPGGDVFGGRSIAQAIRGYPDEVTIQIDGLAASAASTIAAAGDKVIAAADAMVMIHWAWTITLGNKRDHESAVNLLDKIDAQIIEGYQAKAGPDNETDWFAMMDADNGNGTWMTAQEALGYGLVDEVLPARSDKTKNAVEWDLSAYANAPIPSEEPEIQAEVEGAPALDVEPAPEESTDEEITARQRKLAVALL
jgi:ATP-dependent Clp protease protease subunit